MKKFTTIDTGKIKNFSSGMIRNSSDDKIRYDLVPKFMLKRWAGLMTRGAKVYLPHNWTKAKTLEEYQRFRESAWRHFMEYMEGDQKEDHAAAVFFNISGMEYVKEKLTGKYFEEDVNV